MDARQTVYRGQVVRSFSSHDGRILWYVDKATATGIEVDGAAMVKFHDMLIPARDFTESQIQAKQQVVDELIRIVGTIQVQIDTLRDEILHEILSTEERAA